MKYLKQFWSWLKRKSENDKPVPQLQMKPPKKSTGRKVNYEVDCVLYVENKKVGFFPLTVHSFSKEHVEKMLQEGVRLEATNIRTAKIKKNN